MRASEAVGARANDFQNKVDEAVVAVVKRLNLATKDEVAGLKAKVEELSARLGRGPGTNGD